MLLSMLAPPGAPSPEALINFYAEKPAMNYAVVQNGVVINVISWDGATPYVPPDGCTLHKWEGAIDIGWQWRDDAPVDPNPPSVPDAP